MRAASAASGRSMPSPSSARAASALSSSSRTVFKELVRLDVGGLDHPAPGLGFLADVRRELLARAGVRLGAGLAGLLPPVRPIWHPHPPPVPAPEDPRRGLSRARDPAPQ